MTWARALGLAGMAILVVSILAAVPRLQHLGFSSEISWAHLWQWALSAQRHLLTEMRSAMALIRVGDTWTGGAGLVTIAFAYGVLHAAGPGHGKAVITSYALANNETIRRSIVVSVMAAMVQACSAIILVFVGLMILGETARSLGVVEGRLEIFSGILIAALGVYVLASRGRQMLRERLRAKGQEAPGGSSSSHDIDCTCDHAHFVRPADVASVRSWRSAWLLALSVGVRPCTGAVLLLVFARSQGMIWVGLLGTFAMALGTALTVSLLTMAAVGSRDWAIRASRPGSVWSRHLLNLLVMAAGLAIVGLGVAMALTPPLRPPF